jgi:hypothetical protein
MEIGKGTNMFIVNHLEKISATPFMDADVVKEWNNGIDFLHDFGLITLAQWNEFYGKWGK